MADPSFQLQQPHRQPLFSLVGFDEAIVSKGIQLVHYRAFRCPGGLESIHDTRHPHEDHLGCSGGYLFTQAGTLSALFTSNSVQQRGAEPGIVAASNASITMARAYDGGQGAPVRVAQFDRFFLPDDSVLVETWELFQHDPAGDRLRYPVAQVVDLVSASGTRFSAGDFAVAGGRLDWVGNRPKVRPDGRGEVCSVRYLYRPYWYVAYMHHDLRLVTQDAMAPDGTTSRVVAVYQACSIVREYFFKTVDNDPEAPNPRSPRQADPPDEPEFGPR